MFGNGQVGEAVLLFRHHAILCNIETDLFLDGINLSRFEWSCFIEQESNVGTILVCVLRFL